MKFLILVFLFFSLFCKEEKPFIDESIKGFSKPIDGVIPYFKGDILDPFWSNDKKNLPKDLNKLPELVLLDHQNEKLNLDKLKGKYTVVTFFYARCNGVCPLITTNLKNLIPKIKNSNKLNILSISVNPMLDKVEVLKKFRDNYKIENKNWFHLTGEKKLIYEIARKVFSADVKMIQGAENLNDFVHTENIFLLDKDFYLRGIYRAKGTGDLERFLVEFQTLQKDES